MARKPKAENAAPAGEYVSPNCPVGAFKNFRERRHAHLDAVDHQSHKAARKARLPEGVLGLAPSENELAEELERLSIERNWKISQHANGQFVYDGSRDTE